jgi:hypothetical protein
MDDIKIKENIKALNDFLIKIGFTKEMIESDYKRLFTIIFSKTMEKLQSFVVKDKVMTPIESIEDFYKYYEGTSVDKETINKILQEETQKIFTGYLKVVSGTDTEK